MCNPFEHYRTVWITLIALVGCNETLIYERKRRIARVEGSQQLLTFFYSLLYSTYRYIYMLF